MGSIGIPCETRPSNRELNEMVAEWMETPFCSIIDRSGWLEHGRRQFLLMETNERPDQTAGERFIVMVTVEHSRGMLIYKDASESMGPNEEDCPMRLMKKVEGYPVSGMFTASWRERVLRYHEHMRDRRAVLRKLRKEYPDGERRLALNGGREVIYDQGTYRKKRNASAYRSANGLSLTALRPREIDPEATRALWARVQTQPETRVRGGN